MRKAMTIGFVVAALIADVRASGATGGLWCNAADESLTFALRAGLSHGINGGFLDFKADLQVKIGGIPIDFRNLQFDEAAVSQRWLDDKDFKLRLYRERETGPAGYLVLVVITKAVEEGQYRGQYELTVYTMQSADDSPGRTWEERGEIACSAE
jgi:hypothetical protein